MANDITTLVGTFVLGWLTGAERREAVDLCDVVYLFLGIKHISRTPLVMALPEKAEDVMALLEHFKTKKEEEQAAQQGTQPVPQAAVSQPTVELVN
jgi:hypothetical protein